MFLSPQKPGKTEGPLNPTGNHTPKKLHFDLLTAGSRVGTPQPRRPYPLLPSLWPQREGVSYEGSSLMPAGDVQKYMDLNKILKGPVQVEKKNVFWPMLILQNYFMPSGPPEIQHPLTHKGTGSCLRAQTSWSPEFNTAMSWYLLGSSSRTLPTHGYLECLFKPKGT